MLVEPDRHRRYRNWLVIPIILWGLTVWSLIYFLSNGTLAEDWFVSLTLLTLSLIASLNWHAFRPAMVTIEDVRHGARVAPVEDFIEKLEEGSFESAYLEIRRTIRDGLTVDQLQQLVVENRWLSTVQRVSLREVETDNDTPTHRGDLVCETGTVPVEFHLRKENGNFRITELQVDGEVIVQRKE
jgi:hypothetical protein